MTGPHASLKRREPDDLAKDLLNVSLSASKRLRTAESGAGPYFTPQFPGPAWGLSPNALTETLTPVPAATVLSPRPAVEDQKALVLYKPVTPPLFPGGPPIGSVDFPYKVNSSMLPIPQGTDSELTSQLDFQSACSNHKDAPSDHGLFQALDLSGGPTVIPSLRRLNRASSCSSLPRFSADAEDQLMIEEVDKSSELQVIPWVPMTPLMVPSKIKPIIEEVDDETTDGINGDEMVDAESMEVVNEDNVVVLSDTGMIHMQGQFGSPLPTYHAGGWQPEILQPPFTQAMFSH